MVKLGGYIAVSLVKLYNPVINGDNLVQPIYMAWGRRPSVSEPSQLWWIEQGSDHQLVPNALVAGLQKHVELPNTCQHNFEPS